MRFLLRTISNRADGGEIVRETRIDAASVRIGRGNDCDVQVPDLAILLHHATLAQDADGGMRISAVSGAVLEIGGNSVNEAHLDPSLATRVTLGAHALTVGPMAESGLPLTLQRVGALSDASDVRDEVRIFSLSGTGMNKRRLAWLSAMLVLMLFLVWPISAYMARDPNASPVTSSVPVARSIWQADAAWSTGQLSTAHASLQNDCAACHKQAFVAVRDETCLSCHTEVHGHADADRLRIAGAHSGLKGEIRAFIADSFNLPEGRCASCHTEHEGPSPPPTKASLCADCHTGLAQRLPDTSLKDASDFARDHPEFSPSIITHPSFGVPTRKRIPLDQNPREDSGLKFPHKLHLSKTNTVARMAQTLGKNAGYGAALDCASCHRPDATGTRFVPVEMERDCGSCHSLAFTRSDGVVRTLRHGKPEQAVLEFRDALSVRGPTVLDRRIPGDAFQISRQQTQSAFASTISSRARSIFQSGGVCYDCHVISPGLPGAVAPSFKPVSIPQRYMDRGWFSHNDHQTAVTPCTTCHLAEQSNSASDVLLPSISTCRECHSGSHPEKGKITTDCASCHTYHAGAAVPSQRSAAPGSNSGSAVANRGR